MRTTPKSIGKDALRARLGQFDAKASAALPTPGVPSWATRTTARQEAVKISQVPTSEASVARIASSPVTYNERNRCGKVVLRVGGRYRFHLHFTPPSPSLSTFFLAISLNYVLIFTLCRSVLTLDLTALPSLLAPLAQVVELEDGSRELFTTSCDRDSNTFLICCEKIDPIPNIHIDLSKKTEFPADSSDESSSEDERLDPSTSTREAVARVRGRMEKRRAANATKPTVVIDLTNLYIRESLVISAPSCDVLCAHSVELFGHLRVSCANFAVLPKTVFCLREALILEANEVVVFNKHCKCYFGENVAITSRLGITIEEFAEVHWKGSLALHAPISTIDIGGTVKGAHPGQMSGEISLVAQSVTLVGQARFEVAYVRNHLSFSSLVDH